MLGNSGGWCCGSFSLPQSLTFKYRTSAEFPVVWSRDVDNPGGKLHEYPVFFGIAEFKKYKG